MCELFFFFCQRFFSNYDTGPRILKFGINTRYEEFKNVIGRTEFTDQFRKIIIRHKRIGYDLNVMRQSACLVINQSRLITLLHSLIARRWSGVRLYDGTDLKPFILVGRDRSSFVCCLVHRGSTDDILLLQISSCVDWQAWDLHMSCNTLYLLNPLICFFIVL